MNSKVVCRVCANVSSAEEELLKFGSISSIYYRLTALQPSEAILADGACRDCYDKLLLFDGFRTMCLDAYDQLCNQKVLLPFGELKDIKKEIENNVTSEPELNPQNPVDVLEVKVEVCDNLTESDNDDSDSKADDEIDKDEEVLGENSKTVKTKSASKRKKSKESNKIHCDQCDKFFYNDKRYQAHIRVHQGLKPATCDICSKEFAKFTYLKVHMQLVHSEDKKRIMCDVPDCGRTFATLAGMTSHKGLKHLGKLVPKKRHVCEYCGKMFANASFLKGHRDKHEGIKRHTCSICGRSHDTRHKLKIHMMRHEGIKQYSCSFCGLKTTTSSQLKVHMNRHTNEKQYPCGLCEAVFNSSGNKSRHVRLVHQGVKDFKCTYCDRAFGKAETLKHHIMIHTGEKPHACDLCGRRFIQLVALQTHMKTHNKHLHTL